jgi:cyclopropane-fatty-acyl-phospholipid synthase
MNYLSVMDEIFSQFKGKKFSVKLWDGSVKSYGDSGECTFTIVIKDVNTARSLLADGSLGFGEAYTDGRLDIEGDLDEYLRLRHQFKRVKKTPRLIFSTILAKLSTPFNRRSQISYHYDIGNDFFEMILDKETMSYSSGVFKHSSDDISLSQNNKLDLVFNWLDIKQGDSIIDLGFGWGGFIKYATQKAKCYITGYTLSQAQLRYTQNLINNGNLSDLVKLEYRDMIDDLPKKQFDCAVMLESIEHVGKKRLPKFFKNIKEVIKPNGLLYIQLTGRYKIRSVDRWILKYVFPGGYLPSKGEILDSASKAGFVLEKFQDDTSDYIKTITVWIQNLERNKEKIESMFGSNFYRLWRLWMHGAKVSFETEYMNLFRILFRNPN